MFSESSANFADPEPGSARTTTSEPAGNRDKFKAIKCRNCLVRRWRTTEFPTFLPTAKATFDSGLELVATWRTTNFEEYLVPARKTADISEDLRNRWDAESTVRPN